MSELSMGFAPGTLDKLHRSIEKRSKLLNEDMRKSVAVASQKVLVSLRASAKIAPQRREVVENTKGEFSPDRRQESFELQQKIRAWYATHKTKHKRGHLPMSRYIPTKLRGGWKYDAVKSRQPKEHVLLPILHVENKREAAKSPQARISRRGIAKASFGWMMSKLGVGSSGSIREIPGATHVFKGEQKTGTDMTLSIRMVNELRYILSALQGGRRDVTMALSNARSMLINDTKRALARRNKS